MGTTIQQITHTGANAQSPDWAPDGQRLAFSQAIDGQREIYVVGVADGLPQKLTHEAADDAAPSWSRDGRSIYFHSIALAHTKFGEWQQMGRASVNLHAPAGWGLVKPLMGLLSTIVRTAASGEWVSTSVPRRRFCLVSIS